MLQKDNAVSVLEPFFQEPSKRQYLLSISRRIGLAHPSVKKTLVRLVSKGVLVLEIEKRHTRKYPVYYGSTQNTLFRERKKQYNIQHLRESGLIDFLEKSLCPKCIVLFGSYQKGEDVETSDIDLYLECDKTEISVEMYQKRLKRRIQLHFNKDFTQLPRELKNNIVNGTIMRGFLEAYK